MPSQPRLAQSGRGSFALMNGLSQLVVRTEMTGLPAPRAVLAFCHGDGRPRDHPMRFRRVAVSAGLSRFAQAHAAAAGARRLNSERYASTSSAAGTRLT